MPRKVMMNQKIRKVVGKDVQEILKPGYFDGGVPIDKIVDVLKSHRIVLLQEDNTEWSGFFCGAEGRAFIRLAPVGTKWNPDNREFYHSHGVEFYTPFENTGLVLTWYRCENRNDRKYEVVGYIS